jgi:hypothetical protein
MAHTICTANNAEQLLYLRDRWQTLADPRTDLGSKLTQLFATETAEFEMECAFLSAIDLETETQHFQLVHGPDGQLQQGTAVDLDKTYCRKTISAAEGSMAISDAVAEGWEADPAYQEFHISSYVGSTLTVDEMLYGTLCFANTSPRAEPITRSEQHLVEMYSDWAASELSRWIKEPPQQRPIDTITETVISPSQIDAMMDVLTNQTNRTVLLHLLDGTTDVESLEQRLDGPYTGLKLYHRHLPKLAEADYIAWDRESGSLTRGEQFYEVEPLLRLLDEYTTEF